MTTFVRATLLGASLIALACGPDAGDGDGNGNGNNPDSSGTDGSWMQPTVDGSDPQPLQGCSKIDLLFVVDDSGSMAEEQANLAANFPQFIDVLENYQVSGGGTLDYRIGVTTTGRTFTWTMDVLGIPLPTTEMGANGELQQKCGMTKKWLEKGDPDVAGTFACVANVGTSGPSNEMPMYATKMALGDRIADGKNAGFLREDALLAVVMLTDEDDCSREDDNVSVPFDNPDPCADTQPLETPLSYIQFLDQLTGDRGRWATAVIAGPMACSSEFGNAAEAQRLKEFVAEAGTNATFASICAGNLADALADAVNTFDAACQGFPDLE